MNTPLHLDEYFFPIVQVVAGPPIDDIDEDTTDTKYYVEVHLKQNKTDDSLYQLSIDILSQPKEEEWQPYAIHITAVGIFTVDTSVDNHEKLLYINGSSILYSSAREFLITVTSRGPWEPVILPTYSFLHKYKQDVEKNTQSHNES